MHMVNAAVLDQWRMLADEEIVVRVLQGQTALYEVLMRRHNERVYRAARAILRDEREAEDVMQQAYVNAYSHLRQFDGRATFSTWLVRIAVHEALARVRRRARVVAFDPERAPLEGRMPQPTPPDPERQAYAAEVAALLESAIDALPDGMREVFMLRQVEGMSTDEVASALDVSPDVVKTRLSRARAALRRDLLERAGIASPSTFRSLRPRCDRVVQAVLERIV
jgi:RNA polymerase sigma-70 factor, ECF subfamily